MRKIEVDRAIPAPKNAVWKVLADYPNISVWNSGVKKSFSTSEAAEGVGATRHCDLAPMGELEETIREWQPEERLVISIDSAKKLPIKSGLATFTLAESADPLSTTTTVSYEYDLKFGVVGLLLGPILDRQLSSGFGGFLEDLEKAAVSG